MAAHPGDTETSNLGVNIRPGGDHYRAYVGPPQNYDLQAALQFQALTNLGLRENHTLLDVGCGSLRAGRLFITYLLPDRYFGIEPNFKMLEDGAQANFGESIDRRRWSQSSIMKTKRPRFDQNSDFNFKCFETQFDFILAQSILTHTGPKETELFMANLPDVLHANSIVFMTFARGNDNAKRDGWHYPQCVSYTEDYIKALAKKNGMRAEITAWPDMNARMKISGQVPAIIKLRDAR